MESQAHLRFLRMSPRKVGLVAATVRGLGVGEAINALRFTKKAAARPLGKLLKSAVANATDLSKGQLDIDNLWIKSISVDQGPTARRFMPRAMGRASRINKKTAHVHVVLTDAAKKRKKS